MAALLFAGAACVPSRPVTPMPIDLLRELPRAVSAPAGRADLVSVQMIDVAGTPRRRMDCTDCHNRPAHSFSSTPERAVDAAINAGLIDATLPFVRREAVRALAADYPSRDAAR